MLVSTLEDLLQIVKTNKQNADDSEQARHWAIVYTELETVLARVKTYLVTEEE
jgi:hypothetical protein